MLPNAADVLDQARLLVLDRVPLDEMAHRMTAFVMGIRPALAVKRRRPEIVVEEIGDDIVGKELHPAIRVVNDEPFARAKQLMRDHQ
jgi:hypothetical protein